MAMSNSERLYRAFQLLAEGLYDTVDEVMTRVFGGPDWPETWAAQKAERSGKPQQKLEKSDVQVLLRAVTEEGYHFRDVLSRAQQGYAQELRDARNDVMHGSTASISTADALRYLDTMDRLLQAVGAVDSAADIRRMHADLLGAMVNDQTRRKAKQTASVASVPGQGLVPWREVVHPHRDVQQGTFNASEFAADLHLVSTGEATAPEYADPIEFFRRTYLTEGLRDLLTRALRRVSGDDNASPVVNLQTNFGGGKTHSMLALHHLFGGRQPREFPQEMQELITEAGLPANAIPSARRVALVGTAMKPGSVTMKPDGTEVHTMWGELAWQLGGRAAYEMIADDDRNGTSPGSALRDLIAAHSPALILVDEWVAYARQLVTDRDLPAGSFETQFTFAQTLSEVVQSVPGAMLVVSIPASEHGDDGEGADVEVGGANGRQALARLQNVVRRVADQWRPSSRDESFEIVRRRLFGDPDADGQQAIRTVARSFANLYRENSALFPREAVTQNDDYEARIRASYPLHPELLDRLYSDWSTLDRFQRTRGVLKLVSTIVHELWASNDASPLILPGTVPLQETSVSTDLTQYLDDPWKPILDSDIASSHATPATIDKSRENLGARSVTRRLARTIFIGAAPRTTSDRKGIDKQYVWLGTAIPGDRLGDFGQAIDQLGQMSTYFYEEQGHYWFDTRPSVAKTARDYADRLREDPETVFNEIVRRLRDQQARRGAFDRVHPAPATSADIPDLEETRLVIGHPRVGYRRRDDESSASLLSVREMLEKKGSAQRVHRNALVFLLPDAAGLESLEQATRTYLSWKHVHESAESLGLSIQQQRQARESVERHDVTVRDRISDTYIWAIAPQQHDATAPFTLVAEKATEAGTKSLPERVALRLLRSEELVSELGPNYLGNILHETFGDVWRERGSISVGELWDYFTRYPYLPRLTHRSVLDAAVSAAPAAVLVDSESFAVASGKDVETGRYRDLLLPTGAARAVHVTDATLLVDPAVAAQQEVADRAARAATEALREAQSMSTPPSVDMHTGTSDSLEIQEPMVDAAPRFTRFFGTAQIDPQRHARALGEIGREIIDRLAQPGVELEISIDIRARKAGGFDENEVRTIRENARTLKFEPAEFDAE